MPIQSLINDYTKSYESMSESALLLDCLTLGSKIDQPDHILPLSLPERCLTQAIFEDKATYCNPARANLFLAFRPHGRVYLLNCDEYEKHKGDVCLVASMKLQSQRAWADYISTIAAFEESLQRYSVEIRATYSEQSLSSACDRLTETLEHMAPLIFYIDTCCYSNFYKIGKSEFKLERQLKDTVASVKTKAFNSDSKDLTLVYCLDVLMKSGSYTRAEEMNSSQLTPDTIRHFFIVKFESYSNLLIDYPIDKKSYSKMPLLQQAEILSDMRKGLALVRRFVRDVNGINLLKKETSIALANSGNGRHFPSSLENESIECINKITGDDRFTLALLSKDAFPRLFKKNALTLVTHRFKYDIEYLIDKVVKEAVIVTSSDFGMTRGVRNFNKSIGFYGRQATMAACALCQDEYFCHVAQSNDSTCTYAPKTLGMILNAISSRMRFNTWHYMPGHFIQADIPVGRGWFYAPQMADIAKWSDQHHSGHVHATVRYSIRSPLPLRFGKEILPALMDLRLMRQDGLEYTLDDLQVSLHFTQTLQFIYQKLIDHIIDTGAEYNFDFGSKLWYDTAYLPTNNKTQALEVVL